MAQDQRPGIVEQNLLGHAAERREGALHPLEPVLLPFADEGPDMDPARVAERRHEERHQLRRALDLDAPLPEVDLQLLARTGLEPHRRPRLGAKLPTQMRHRTLDRAQAHLGALLGCELLADNVGIARVAAKPLLDPPLEAVQPLHA